MLQRHTYKKVPIDQIEELAAKFDTEHGDPPHGHIQGDQFDRFYDHLAAAIAKHGSFSEQIEDALEVDFSGSRLTGEPLPVIGIVPRTNLSPDIALAAGLEATQSSFRPMGILFDFYPHCLFVVTPNKVYGTYDERELTEGT